MADQQTRLTSPHPRSFLAFALHVQTHFDEWDTRMKKRLSGSTLDASKAPVGRILAYFEQTAADWRHEIEMAVRHQLGRVVLPEAFETQIGKEVLDDQINLVSSWLAMKDELASLKRRDLPKDSNAHKRAITVEIVVGAHLSLSDNERNRAAVARLLNQGVPTMAAGVQSGHVRNALDAFAARVFRLSDGNGIPLFLSALELACTVIALRWRTLEYVWRRAEQWSRPNPWTLQKHKELEKIGLLFEWRREFERAPDLSGLPSTAAVSEILHRKIGALKAIQAKMDRPGVRF